jgi:hypothetical protein
VPCSNNSSTGDATKQEKGIVSCHCDGCVPLTRQCITHECLPSCRQARQHVAGRRSTPAAPLNLRLGGKLLRHWGNSKGHFFGRAACVGRINRVTLHITPSTPGCATKTAPNSWQSMVSDHRISDMQYHLASPAQQAALNLVYSHAQQLFFLRGVLKGQHVLQVQEAVCNYVFVRQACRMVLLVATTSCAAQHSASQHSGLPLAAVWVSAGQRYCVLS